MRTKSRVVFDYLYNPWFFIIQNSSNFDIVLKHSKKKESIKLSFLSPFIKKSNKQVVRKQLRVIMNK